MRPPPLYAATLQPAASGDGALDGMAPCCTGLMQEPRQLLGSSRHPTPGDRAPSGTTRRFGANCERPVGSRRMSEMPPQPASFGRADLEACGFVGWRSWDELRKSDYS